MWSLANGWQLMLKALSNGRFLLILLNGKRKKDKRLLSGNRGAKIKEVFSEDTFLIIPIYWPSLCLSKTSICICRENHIRKKGRNNPGLNTYVTNRNKEIDNLSTSPNIADTNKKANNLRIGINIADINRGANNLGKKTDIPNTDNINERVDKLGISTNTSDVKWKVANLSTGIDIANADKDTRVNSSINTNTIDANVDGGADPNTSTNIVDAHINKRVNNSGIKTTNVDRQMAANDKAHIFFFFFVKPCFFLSFFLN